MSAAEISPQLILFLISVVSGFAMGGIYDIIRIFRRIIRHMAVLMFVEDVLYWIFAVAVVFFIMLSMTRGEVRFFAIAGFFIGMIVYFCTLSRLIISVSEAIIKFIKALLRKTFAVLSVPIKILYKILCFIVRPFTAILTKLDLFFKKHLKKIRICAKIILSRILLLNGRKKTDGGDKANKGK